MRRAARIFWLGLKEVLSLRRDAVMMALLIYSFTLAVVTERSPVRVLLSARGHDMQLGNDREGAAGSGFRAGRQVA
ncbi:MAG: hypothetical protein R3298_06210 [Gammaproteobacteria bacterium]|nr:hypothetical protein [Gammaproteobacteria bacterium]